VPWNVLEDMLKILQNRILRSGDIMTRAPLVDSETHETLQVKHTEYSFTPDYLQLQFTVNTDVNERSCETRSEDRCHRIGGVVWNT
jgi:hypothetical protein